MARKKAPSVPGSILLQKIRATLEKKGWPLGLTVLAGDDLYHMDAAQRAILDHLVRPEETEFALTVFGGGGSRVGVGTAVTAARSLGMFSPRRVVLVKDVNVLDGEPDAVEEYATAPPEGSYLIVRADALDKRRKLHKTISTCGTQLRFDVGRGREGAREMARELHRMAAERNLQIEDQAGRLMLEGLAGDLYRVRSELDKIRSWIGGDAPAVVGERELRAVASGGGVLTGWEVADALLDRDAAAGLSAARLLVASGSEPLMVLGAVASRARSMLQAKAMLEEGRPEREVLRAVRGAWFFEDRLLQGLRKYSLAEMLEFPRRLAGADRALKSSTMDPASVVENLIRGMIGSGEETVVETGI